MPPNKQAPWLQLRGLCIFKHTANSILRRSRKNFIVFFVLKKLYSFKGVTVCRFLTLEYTEYFSSDFQKFDEIKIPMQNISGSTLLIREAKWKKSVVEGPVILFCSSLLTSLTSFIRENVTHLDDFLFLSMQSGNACNFQKKKKKKKW